MDKIQPFVDFLLGSDLYSSTPVYFLYCLAVSHKLRKSNSWSQEETFRNPVGSLVSILIVNFGGPMILSALNGTGLVNVFSNDLQVALVVSAWLLVYFSPFDLVFQILDTKLLKAITAIVIGWKRSRDIIFGVHVAKTNGVSSLTTSLLYGVIYGWGGSLLFPYEGQSRFRTLHNDLLLPSNAFISVLFASFASAALGPAYGFKGSSWLSHYVSLLSGLAIPGIKQLPFFEPVIRTLTMSKEASDFLSVLITLVSALFVESGLMSFLSSSEPSVFKSAVSKKTLKATTEIKEKETKKAK